MNTHNGQANSDSPGVTSWQGVPAVDHRHEVCALREITSNTLTWVARDLEPAMWQVDLSDRAVTEILAVADHIRENPMKHLQREENTLPWPTVRSHVAELRHMLDAGRGFAVLRGLPVDEIDETDSDVLVEIYWLLGQIIAPTVAQKWDGEMIYSVRDTGTAYGYGVRGSKTSVELVFHVDNAFGRAVPDYVGLLCKQPAKEGGLSRFCSLYTVHQRLAAKQSDALERLYQPMLFDRQKEHGPGSPKVLLAPFFSWRDERLFARANTSLVRKGYQVAGVEMDQPLLQALDAVDEICTDEAIWFEAPLERGHIQYLNNHEIGHYRSEFIDHEDSALKRHLYRLWHRNHGSRNYDGIVAKT